MSKTFKKMISQEQFQDWLAHMDDALEEFLAWLPAEVRERLDGSPESLGVLEAWLLERYPTMRSIPSDDEWSNLDGATRYVGEVFRKRMSRPLTASNKHSRSRCPRATHAEVASAVLGSVSLDGWGLDSKQAG